MNNITIFADSCCSLEKDIAKQMNVEIIPTFFRMENDEYNPLDDEILSYDTFYSKLENKALCKTSCINPNTFIEYFSKELKKGNDVIYISLSSGLSSSYNNACLAKSMLEDEYENKIEIIDSLTGSLGIQVVINKACELRKLGNNVSELKEKLDKNKLNIESLFTIGDLDHLRRGGRISSVKAVIGKIVKIYPIITTDKEGKLVSKINYRGKKQTLNKMIEYAKNNIVNNETLFIAYTNNIEEADYVRNSLKEVINDIVIGRIDYTMGAHCGPGTLAIFYISKKEEL